MARKKAAKKKAAKKTAKKAPARTSARGAQMKSKMSGRTKTARGTSRGQKQQPAAQSAKQAPQRKAGAKSPAAKSSAPKARAPKVSAPKAPARNAAKTASEGRPRKQDRPERTADTARLQAGKRRDRPAKRRQPRWDESADRMMEMPPATREEREQRPQFTQGGDEDGPRQQTASLPDGEARDGEDLDHARRHTAIRDESEDEGYGRSEGAENRRMSQMGEYGADDDDQHYGRNLGGRNRIPGGGSRRNR